MTFIAKHTPGPWVWDKFADGHALVSEGEMPYGTTRKAIDLSYEGPNRNLLAAAPAQALILELVRHGLMTLADGDAEYDGVMYWFLDEPDWCVHLVNAIGWDAARSAIIEATADEEA